MRRPCRRLVISVLALAGLAALLSGCLGITNADVGQRDGIGPVTFIATICAHKDGSSCPRGDPARVQTASDPGQMLVAFRVPIEYPTPQTFTFSGRTTPVFRPSPSYTSELQRLVPAAAGTRWAGYISDVHGFTPGDSASFLFVFDRPAPADGSPRPRNAEVSIIAGARTTSGVNGDVATRPVHCGATSADVRGYADNTVCQDYLYGVGAPGP